MRKLTFILFIILAVVISSCDNSQNASSDENSNSENTQKKDNSYQMKKYATVKLTTDMSQLSENEKKMLPLLIEAAKLMDECFKMEAWPDKNKTDISKYSEAERAYLEVNYGPWDRLNGNLPFLTEYGEKPLGSGFYPADITRAELIKSKDISEAEKSSLYTMIQRKEGKLVAIPYHEFFKEQHIKAAGLLKQASEFADDAGLKKYLGLRADALRTDDYTASDLAWMDMQDNGIDIIIGPIETYEDQLTGFKAAHSAYILVKDKAWTKKLAYYSTLLPELQAGLPVDDKYKQDKVGRGGQLAAFDVIYYAGDCNAGSKTIAVNLPNDEKIQQQKGTRRSQLKNAMRAKFDKILIPIAELIVTEDQRKHITFDAFFGNTMFHEVAHGLGIKNTITGKGTVREALKEEHSALEEGKADIVGLYMVSELFKKGEIKEGVLLDNYVTFMAGIFRSVRFGASSAHGRANMLRFNYFQDHGAFSRDEKTGEYSVNPDKMQEAMTSLSALILQLQGDGDYEAVKKLMLDKGIIKAQLKAELERIDNAGIPVDVIFEQGF